MNKLYGIIPPVISPIDEHENIIESELRFLVDLCIKNEFAGIFIAGTSGESMALNQEQRNNAIKIVMDETKGRIPVICGVMDTSTKKVMENIKTAEAFGGEIFAVTPVFYTNSTTQDEIIRHFELLSNNTEGKILIYNQPLFTNVRLTFDTIKYLSKIENIVGIKNSSIDWLQFQEIVFTFRNSEFSILQGITEFAGPSLLLGADGFIPVFGFLFPKLYKQLYEAAVRKDIDTAIILQDRLNAVSKILKKHANTISGAKIGMHNLFSLSVKMCEPHVTVSDEKITAICNTINYYRKEFEE